MNEPKNFYQMVDTLHSLGIHISDNATQIVVTVYDYNEGRTLIKELEIDEYDAVRIFGDYTIFDLRIENNRMAFTLNAPKDPDAPEETEE